MTHSGWIGPPTDASLFGKSTVQPPPLGISPCLELGFGGGASERRAMVVAKLGFGGERGSVDQQRVVMRQGCESAGAPPRL
jgi:hypothetical protein